MKSGVDQVDSVWWTVVSTPVGTLPMFHFAIWERAWPSTVVKLPTATSALFCLLTESCSTLVIEPALLLCVPERTELK